MIRQFERQPIENATVLVFDDNGTQSLIIEPYDGYKLRKINKTQLAAALEISRPTLDKLLKEKELA